MQTVAKAAKTITSGTFAPADVVEALDATWLDETLCRSWVLLRLHHRGAGCPSCGEGITAGQRERFFGLKRIRCAACGKYFNALTGTFLSGSRLDMRRLVLLNFLLGLGLSDSKIAAIIGLDTTNVWRYRKRAEEINHD